MRKIATARRRKGREERKRGEKITKKKEKVKYTRLASYPNEKMKKLPL